MAEPEGLSLLVVIRRLTSWPTSRRRSRCLRGSDRPTENSGATIHRRFTYVAFCDPPPHVRRYGENPYGKDFPDSITEVERLTGRTTVKMRLRQDVERRIDWVKLWDGESYRDPHSVVAIAHAAMAAAAGTAPITNHAKAAENQRATGDILGSQLCEQRWGSSPRSPPVARPCRDRCHVVTDDDLHAELAMIDENLCRAELSPAERAKQTARRKAIYLIWHPETDQGLARDRLDNLSTRRPTASRQDGEPHRQG